MKERNSAVLRSLEEINQTGELKTSIELKERKNKVHEELEHKTLDLSDFDVVDCLPCFTLYPKLTVWYLQMDMKRYVEKIKVEEKPQQKPLIPAPKNYDQAHLKIIMGNKKPGEENKMSISV